MSLQALANTGSTGTCFALTQLLQAQIGLDTVPTVPFLTALISEERCNSTRELKALAWLEIMKQKVAYLV